MIEYQFKPGDIIGFSGKSLQSDMINIGTYGIPRWSISHVGIVITRLSLIEALPNGVQPSDISKTIEKYNGRVWIYPLYRELYFHELDRLSDSLFDTLGVPYDEIGAVRSAGFAFAVIQALFRGQDLSTFFCSELIANKLSDIGIHPVINASKWNPNRLIRRLRQERIIQKPIRLK